jgi:tetratricopeptide (TPR) repeat protein
VRINSTLAMAYKGLGDALTRQGKEREALGHYERSRALGYAPPAMELAMARSLLKQRRWEPALKLLQEIARARPSAEVYIGMGDSYAALKQPASASAAYRQAAQAEPKSALAHYKHGEQSFQLREYAAAMEALERALALDPAGVSFDRGRAREMADRAAAKLGGKK